MFNKLQNHLLLHHPLLWNTRIVSVLAISIVLHIIFFIIGYLYGEVDFSESNYWKPYNGFEDLMGFLSTVITLLLTVVWLVFYLRNNSFKAYYPKNRLSLYKEWLLLLLICIINCAFMASFLYGSDVRKRSYFSEEELLRRIEVIKMASLFADGPYQEDGRIVTYNGDEQVVTKRDSFEYNNRNYSLNSLINKGMVNLGPIYGNHNDSLIEVKAKKWLIANKKDSILWVMKEFDKIAREHGAKGNITPQQWLDMVYYYPEYTRYIKVGTEREEQINLLQYHNGNTYTSNHYDEYGYVEEVAVPIEVEAEDEENDTIPLDTLSFRKVIVEGNTYIQHKYYVPQDQIVNAYGEMAEGYYRPAIDAQGLLFFMYTGMGMSLLLFSFRVTSGRSWLIAAVAFGVIALLTGILNLLVSYFLLRGTGLRYYDEEMYLGFWIVLVTILLIRFLTIKKAKGFSAVILNIVLWLTPAILPVLGIILNIYYRREIEYIKEKRITPYRPLERWLEENFMLYLVLCTIAYIIFMYFFTNRIKKWKGLPEA